MRRRGDDTGTGEASVGNVCCFTVLDVAGSEYRVPAGRRGDINQGLRM